MISVPVAFDNDAYFAKQCAEILSRASNAPPSGKVYIEFGGKAYDDQHAARVLPGYDPDIKLRLLKFLTTCFEIIVAVSARDLLKPRIRGDSQLFYDSETIRVIKSLLSQGVPVSCGVVTMWNNSNCSNEDRLKVRCFIQRMKLELGLDFYVYPLISGYPNPLILRDVGILKELEPIKLTARNILVFSPGGGSGKFGFCLLQLLRDFISGINSVYIKFETFPISQLPSGHPLNLAFLAATADLRNALTLQSDGLTAYDKDVQNFALLMACIEMYCPDIDENFMSCYGNPSDMSVNRVVDGFLNEVAIKRAAKAEIQRRLQRYRREIERRIEFPETLEYLCQILGYH